MLLTGQLVVPEGVAALPMFAKPVVENASAKVPPAVDATPRVEIVGGDVVIRASADADEVLLTRSIRAVRAAAS